MTNTKANVQLIIATLLATIVAFTYASISFAGDDILLDVPVKQVVEKIDKNGNPYKRIIFSKEASLNGVKYNRSEMLMVFSDTIDMVADLQPGDQLKCIASTGEYRGRTSYTLLAVIE